MNNEDLAVFEDPNFSAEDYINNKFPDENSLANLDQEIERVKRIVGDLNKEIVDNIHEHALLNNKAKMELENTKKLTVELIDDIKELKDKALESEKIVEEMCKDIKVLDLAKKNMTLCINALRKFADLLGNIDTLQKNCINKNFKDSVNIVLIINDLVAYFKPYEKIPQIQEAFKEKNNIIDTYKTKIKDEVIFILKEYNTLDNENIKYACQLIESFGKDYKDEIIKFIVNYIITQYQETVNLEYYYKLGS